MKKLSLVLAVVAPFSVSAKIGPFPIDFGMSSTQVIKAMSPNCGTPIDAKEGTYVIPHSPCADDGTVILKFQNRELTETGVIFEMDHFYDLVNATLKNHQFLGIFGNINTLYAEFSDGVNVSRHLSESSGVNTIISYSKKQESEVLPTLYKAQY